MNPSATRSTTPSEGISRKVPPPPSGMIRRLSSFPSDVVAVVCSGNVTKLEYDTVLVPAVATALRTHPKLGLYYQTGLNFSIDAGALAADVRLGLEHITRWERVALVTDIEWVPQAVHALGFLLQGELKVFSLSDTAKARAWVSERRAS